MFQELSTVEISAINGGANWLKIVGGGIIIVGGAMGCAVPGGQLAGAVTIVGGAACVWDGIWS